MVWTQKHATAEGNAFHKKRDWLVQFHAQLHNEARKFLDGWTRFHVWGKDGEAIKEVSEDKRVLRTKLNIQKEAIINIPIVNMCAPCCITEDVKQSMAALSAWLLTENDESIGLAFLPVFAYRKNHIWTDEKAAIDTLTKGCVNADMAFHVLFTDQVDSRDERPMTYSGRFLVPQHCDMRKSLWKSSALVKMKRTEEIKQLAAKEMLMIEDVSSTSLPTSTDDAAVNVQGAAKYEQLGTPCMEAVLGKLMEGVELHQRGCFVVVDMRVRVANTLMALVRLRSSWTTPFHYIGFCDTMVEFDFVMNYAIREVARMLIDKELTIPGLKVDREPPSDLLEAPPPPPTLNTLILGGPSKKQLQLPAAFVRNWSEHSTFKDEFNKFIDGFHDEFGLAMETPAEEPIVGAKRKASNNDEVVVPAAKKRSDCIDPSRIVEASQVVGQKLYDAPLANVKNSAGQVRLSLRAGDSKFITNMSGQASSMPKGFFVCGLGKGGFKLMRKDRRVELNFISIGFVIMFDPS